MRQNQPPGQSRWCHLAGAGAISNRLPSDLGILNVVAPESIFTVAVTGGCRQGASAGFNFNALGGSGDLGIANICAGLGRCVIIDGVALVYASAIRKGFLGYLGTLGAVAPHLRNARPATEDCKQRASTVGETLPGNFCILDAVTPHL